MSDIECHRDNYFIFPYITHLFNSVIYLQTCVTIKQCYFLLLSSVIDTLEWCTQQSVATVMVTTAHITTAGQIIPSYLSGDASVHPIEYIGWHCRNFCSISMPVDFCCHLVGKNSWKCLSLWLRLNTLCWLSQCSYEHFLKLTDSIMFK